MTHPLNPARTITAPYRADLPPPLPERIKALLGKRPADLSRRDLLDIAADAANRDPWDLCGDREHVGAICDLAGTLEAELAEAEASKDAKATRDLAEEHERQGQDLAFHRHGHNAALVELETERKAHAETRDLLEALLGAGAALPQPLPSYEGVERLSVLAAKHSEHEHPSGAPPVPCRHCGTSTHACLSRPVIERCWDCRSCPCTCAVPSGALESLLTTGPDEPGPHDAVTVDCALDDETRVATDEELRR